MRYLVDITPEQSQMVRALVEDGRYGSAIQFVETAIANQLSLEERPLGALESSEVTIWSKNEGLSSFGAATLVRGDRLLLAPPRKVPITEETPMRKQGTIWGMYNRVFPAKITLRVLANLVAESGSTYVDLLRLHDACAKRARFIGKVLLDDDEKSGRLHGEKLSTGLPIGSPDKSTERFKAMFVGRRSSTGRVEGMPVSLGFMVIKEQKEGGLVAGLSKVGAEFASLRNPILDEGNTSTDETLSEEEVEFYLTHLRKNLPTEWELCQDILRSISQGKNTPEELDAVAAKRLVSINGPQLTTERAGVVSRLTELGLLKRKRTGLQVTYTLTTKGEQYLNLRETRASASQ